MVTLFVQRRVAGGEENGIIELCWEGDNEGIKKLVVNRPAWPSDADPDLGHTAEGCQMGRQRDCGKPLRLNAPKRRYQCRCP